jgi:hypothetical protein
MDVGMDMNKGALEGKAECEDEGKEESKLVIRGQISLEMSNLQWTCLR